MSSRVLSASFLHLFSFSDWLLVNAFAVVVISRRHSSYCNRENGTGFFPKQNFSPPPSLVMKSSGEQSVPGTGITMTIATTSSGSFYRLATLCATFSIVVRHA